MVLKSKMLCLALFKAFTELVQFEYILEDFFEHHFSLLFSRHRNICPIIRLRLVNRSKHTSHLHYFLTLVTCTGHWYRSEVLEEQQLVWPPVGLTSWHT